MNETFGQTSGAPFEQAGAKRFRAGLVPYDGRRSPLRVWPLRRAAAVTLTASGLLVLALWTTAGLLYMWLLDDGPVGDADRDLAGWIAEHRTDRLDTWADIGSGFSDALTVVILIAVVGGTMVVVWRRWHDGVFLAVALIFEASTFALTSVIVGRERPPVGQLDGGAATGSFPSGHVAAAVACYGALRVVAGWHTRRRIVLGALTFLAIVIALAVAASRAYLGMHHPIDIASGAVLGALSIVLVHRGLAVGTAAIRDEAARQPMPERVVRLDLTDPVVTSSNRVPPGIGTASDSPTTWR